MIGQCYFDSQAEINYRDTYQILVSRRSGDIQNMDKPEGIHIDIPRRFRIGIHSVMKSSLCFVESPSNSVVAETLKSLRNVTPTY